MVGAARYWLLKSEPTTFSIGHLARCPHQTDWWDGVRNHQARQYLQAMRLGDRAFFYHSNCKEPAIWGTVSITHEAIPDATARDPQSPYFDPRACDERPIWFAVGVTLQACWPAPVLRATLKTLPALQGMLLLQRGSRLSVQPVSDSEWSIISALAPA